MRGHDDKAIICYACLKSMSLVANMSRIYKIKSDEDVSRLRSDMHMAMKSRYGKEKTKEVAIDIATELAKRMYLVVHGKNQNNLSFSLRGNDPEYFADMLEIACGEAGIVVARTTSSAICMGIRELEDKGINNKNSYQHGVLVVMDRHVDIPDRNVVSFTLDDDAIDIDIMTPSQMS
jgi:hypothetical protein